MWSGDLEWATAAFSLCSRTTSANANIDPYSGVVSGVFYRTSIYARMLRFIGTAEANLKWA